MYKLFTLAAAAAFLPIATHLNNNDQAIKSFPESSTYFLSFKNQSSFDPFTATKNNTAAWTPNWQSSAQENIRKSEYHFKWEEKLNAYCTPNRKNNLRFFYDDKGFSVEPRITNLPEAETDLAGKINEAKSVPLRKSLNTFPNQPTGKAGWKLNFNLDKKQVGKGVWKVEENKSEYISKKITVQYINSEEGMRQNFIVHKPLSKVDQLKINFSIKTKLKIVLTNEALQFFHEKTNVLNYDQLKVWDANGKLLEAGFKKNKRNSYSIQVNTKDAVYPITIDPLSTTPNSTPDDANQANADFGWSVASAGDVNGDGYSDVIIGAYAYEDAGNFFEGRVFVYHGSVTGLPASPTSILDGGNQADGRFGISVNTAGDVNGDGYSDVIIGANTYDDAGNANEGRAFVYHGSATGLSASPISTPDDANQAGAAFGWSVASAGDVNGDGYSDVIIGAYFYTEGGNTFEGRAYVYHGSAAGIVASPNNIYSDANQANAYFGYSVASAGDVNGDGFSDVIIGAYGFDDLGNNQEGRAFVYHGSLSGLSATPNNTPDDANLPGASFGDSVAPAGDINGDGYSDVIIGAYGYNDGANNLEGRAFVYHGSATGLSAAPNSLPNDADQAGARFGASVASAGDINGDGYSDVIIGAPFYDDGANIDEGQAFVYHGSAAGLSATPNSILNDANQAGCNLGVSVASAGDINGDGYSDVIVGAPDFTDGPNTSEGRAFVYHGAAAGVSATPNSTPNDANQAGAFFGFSVAGAGDVNGDGYSDVIIGAYSYDDGANLNEGRTFVYYGSATGISAAPNSFQDDANQDGAQFGISVAGAGDVNGDGYSDVIIGAYTYDDAPNNTEGRAFLYHGSATGLSISPNSTPDDANQIGAQFGVSVASAGDVNGDGFSDVIIGAHFYDDAPNTNEGRAYVYHGSASGLSASPNNILDGANQTNALFGISVSSAGDVNGDGFSDVIIGAPFSGEGIAFVYHGSISGVSASPDNTPDDANQLGARFGYSVSAAGDVNGDGYGDVIIGAPFYDEGANTDQGRAFVYHGSATGLSAFANNIPNDANQAGAEFGCSVAGAGDVNGDGYSDVVIGANSYDDGVNTDEGFAFVYHGSATGLGISPNITPDDANQANAEFGISVAGAGDTNGDGFSDIIIGANKYDEGGNIDEGRALLYKGNEFTLNRRNNLRLYNSNLTTNLNSSNYIFGNFGAGLFAKSFLGRAKGKLVWETKISYNPYSGTPITNSTFFTAQQANYSDLGLTGIELKNLIDKILGGRYTKLRARIKYDPVTAITGQVYSPWRNVSSIIDANNLGVLPIELISFKASWKQKGKSAQLDFSTDKELGICCFDIEKSPDGFNFSPIGSLPAKNTAGIQSYSFIDNAATAKKQFYRLKIKGMAGQVDYSNIQQLQNNGATEILVFPNPTTDKLQLQLNGHYGNMQVKIINTAGQVVKQWASLPIQNQTLSIPVSNLSAGNYWIALESGSEKQVLQFMKN